MSRPYHNSFWSCFSPFDLCLKACCCPCVVYGKNHYRSTHDTEQGYDTFNGHCAAWAGLACLGHWGWILQFVNRTDMHDKYNLEGSCCGSCLRSWCCHCCELIQTHKELDYIQVSQVDHAHAAGYQKPAAMVADPNLGYAPSPAPGKQPLPQA